MQMIVCIILLLHGMYTGAIFFMASRKKLLFYFSGIVVCTVLTIMMNDDKLLLSVFPLSLELSLKIHLLSYMGSHICILRVVQLLLGRSRIVQTVSWDSVFLPS
ncbi:hypothetical protein QD47_19875 [Paenibacillus terrae]|uniref:Uncharacterized protein n=1 Tax=Paenibacillus terrae TaxID=159743 RepID=A0A0D7WXR3_9BACL|nr:hypothetical protein QD47_19875 [Paenibacillus terrae]